MKLKKLEWYSCLHPSAPPSYISRWCAKTATGGIYVITLDREGTIQHISLSSETSFPIPFVKGKVDLEVAKKICQLDYEDRLSQCFLN